MRVALPRRWSARLSAVDRWLLLVRPVAVLVVLLGVAASTWIAQGWQATITRQRDERLDRTAVSRTATVSAMLAHYEDALLAERSLWLASKLVSREDFRNFASTLDLQDRYPGLQRIGWREQVPGEARARFLARARRDRALYAAKEGGRNRWCASPQPGSDQVEPVAVPEPSESR